MLVVGFVGGLAFSTVRTTHAAGQQGAMAITNGTDFSGCATASFGCTPTELTNVCNVEGSSDWIQCDFQAATHAGGTIHEENVVPCYEFTAEGFATATQSTIDDTPSGHVLVRCYFPNPPSAIGLRQAQSSTSV
jgi:hypothetical protein